MISVIMASYLGNYHRAAGDRDHKFRRAVRSFLQQNIGELIIVADGCDITESIVKNEFQHPTIKLIKIQKQRPFAGIVRQTGIEQAKYDWICYLDSDDEFTPTHLQTVVSNLDSQFDWIWYDDIIQGRYRECSVTQCRIGTSCIVHKKSLNVSWPDGYMHDWYFIKQLGENHKKIHGAGYIVRHVPGSFDE